MRNSKTVWLACCVLAIAALFAVLTPQADQWDKKTILTLNETVQIPGTTLAPGKYVFRLMESPANRHIVTVYNADETQHLATLIAIPNDRVRPVDKEEFSFWEMPQGQTPALRAWFYPGDNFGQEFAYPADVAAQIAAATNQQVPSLSSQDQSSMAQNQGASSTTANSSTANNTAGQPVDTASAQTTNQDMNTTQPSNSSTSAATSTTDQTTSSATTSNEATPSTTTAQNNSDMNTNNTTSSSTMDQNNSSSTASSTADQSNASTASSSLPSTASPLPLLGLLGMASLGLGTSLRTIRRFFK